MNLTIDPEFKNLIPPLTSEEYAGLEESILAEGCRDSLVAWHGILIDGHNRYEICEKYGIPYSIMETDFESRDAVKLWMMKNQLARRNLNGFQRVEIVHAVKDAIRAEAKKRQGTRTDLNNIPVKLPECKDSRDILGEMAGVSGSTYERAAKVIEQGTPETKEALRRGEMSINQAYTEIKKQEKAEQRAEKMEAVKEAAIQDGNLVCGDCTIELETLSDGTVDCVVTDPPYGINYVSNRRTIESEVVKAVANDSLEDALKLWETVCGILYKKMKADSHLYCFTSWKVYPQFAEIIGRYFKIKNCLVWVKNNHGSGDLEGNYSEQYEMVIFATKGNRKLNGNRESNVLTFDKVASLNLLHSCEKPVDLLSFLIEKSTDAGELVVDPFMGSGSTIFAAKQTGRSYWGCELDEENYRIACGRCANV